MASAVILAAGQGKRMNSDIPKPLVKIDGKTLLEHTLEKLRYLPVKETVVVVGYKGDEIAIKTTNPDIRWVFQEEMIGNADALRKGITSLYYETDTVLTLQADDSTFYKPESLRGILEMHLSHGAMATLMSVQSETTKPHSQILRDGFRYVGRENTTPDGKAPVEFYTGCAIFDRKWIESRLNNIPLSYSGEITVTSLFDMAREEGEKVMVFPLTDSKEWRGVNTQDELEEARRLYKEGKERN